MGDASPIGTHSAPKLAILRSKIEKKNSGEGAHPHGEGDSPSPPPIPIAAFARFARSASTTSPTNDFWIRNWLVVLFVLKCE